MHAVQHRIGNIMLLGALLLVLTGCGQQQGHKREQKKIAQKREEEEKATADLVGAVLATDTAGWDAAGAYGNFSATTRPRLIKNKRLLADFTTGVSQGHRKIPVRYRRRIRKLEQRNEELSQRLAHYHIKDKTGWEDFTALYQYDLQGLEQDIQKLTGRRQHKKH